MVFIHDDDDDADRLRSALEERLELLGRARAITLAELGRLAGEHAALGYHPNYLGYLYGGDFASRGMGAAHILPLIGLHRRPFEEAIDRLAQTGVGDAGDGDLLVDLRVACERDQALEEAGFVWLNKLGLLKRGAVDNYWLKRPTLGLGQSARLHGLTREDHDSHRGLYALGRVDLRDRFAAVAPGEQDTSYGGLLRRVIEVGGPALAALGTAAIHQDAKRRYDTDGRSFAAHQRATTRRVWRGKPALSAQGHLARSTADSRGIDLPVERTPRRRRRLARSCRG